MSEISFADLSLQARCAISTVVNRRTTAQSIKELIVVNLGGPLIPLVKTKKLKRTPASANGKDIGDWGEKIAACALLSRGVVTCRDFRVPSPNGGTFRPDLFDPETRTVYEVKTGIVRDTLLFRYQLDNYHDMVEDGTIRNVTYVNVSYGDSGGIAPSARDSILEAGFKIMSIGETKRG
jgi:hypothetical protein